METSLHRQLKTLYAGETAQVEVRLAGYRIDAVAGDLLVEVQHGSLAAIRDKVRALVKDHDVLIVKPIVARKTLVRQDSAGGRVLSRRLSPKRGALIDLFDELVYFTRVFPHRRLAIEAVLVDVEEWRYPGHGRRRRWRRDDQTVEDQRLVEVGESVRLADADDLLQLLPAPLPQRFHTGELAECMSIRRQIAQRVAYCLREIGATRIVGKQGNAQLYERIERKALRKDRRTRRAG